MPKTGNIFDAADAEAQRWVERALTEGATTLSLAGLAILSLPRSLERLTLISLDLSYCGQVEDLQLLAGLHSLQSLNLNGCEQVQDLQLLVELHSLQSLNLSFCGHVQDLQPLAGLHSLQSLDLSGCGQVEDLQLLAGLHSLQSLDLSGCRQVQDLRPLGALNKLESFRFIGGLLDCSPTAEPMSSWPVLSKLYADGIVGAPSELGSKEYEDVLPGIRAWQNDLLAGEAPNSALKVLVLGNGRVGKTQVSRRLLGRDFEPSIPSTHGIAFEELQLAPSQAALPEVRAKLWDFGGQSIYLGTHGLFLDERAIYVIAWSPRYESGEETELSGISMENRPLTYWLDYIRSLAGLRAPVIVTQTQCDRETDVRTPPLPAGHGFERLRATYSSAAQPDGMERLQMELKSAARSQLEQYGKVRLPLSWCSIAEELEARRAQKTISYSEFEALCRTGHKTAVASTVLEYLHRSGQVFYRRGVFDNQVVLDLDWALKGIYAVLDRERALPVIQRQAGRFTTQLLAALVWQEYGPAEHELFISLMQQCQICFKIAEDMYVAPALLPRETEVHASLEQVWRAATTDAAAHLDYGFLHEGVLRAVLCGLGEKAGMNAVYWAYGICFYDRESQSTARISAGFLDPEGHNPGGRITVEAAGAQASVLAEHLVASIERVNRGARPQVTWTVGGPSMKKEDAVKDETKGTAPFDAIRPAQFPRAADEPQPIYVSYAWGGESEALVDEFEATLPGNLKLIRDKDVLQAGDWISRFMQEMARADCVLVVLSEKYLRSYYCMRELLYLYQSSQGEHAVFLERLIPLTVGDVRFSRAVDRDEHILYWEAEDRKLDAVLAKRHHLNVGSEDRAEQLAIKDFVHRVSDILAWVANTLMPRGSDPHTKAIDAAIDLIGRRMRKPDLGRHAAD